MAVQRTTIMAEPHLIDVVNDHIKTTGENMTDFYNRAILNQLENDGNWTIRDEMEELKNAESSK